jgi:hypothetical protein
VADESAGAGDGQPGDGAPGNGSSKDDGESKDGDKEFVPVSRLKAALATQKQHHDRELAAFRAEFEAFKAGAATSEPQPKKEEPKRYTRAQLNAAVEARQITQDQADEAWASQVESDATERATRTALAAVDERQKKERVDTEIARYRELKPEIMEKGSETRQQIVEEYKSLVAAGSPEGVPTELAAIKSVLGPLAKLEKAAGARREADPDQQSGGDGGRPAKKSGSGKLVDTLSPREKEHYEKGIKAGRYKDWTEVEAELKYANPTLRQKHGAAV